MISFIQSAKYIKDFPNTTNEVVFVGRSNAGKSSLLNALYKKDLAFVGKNPGKTKLINFFNIDDKYTAVDVPGYGYANRSKNEQIEFGKMMDDYFNHREQIKLVVCIFDSRIGQTEDDSNMIEYLDNNKHKYIIVYNKIDKLNQSELHKVKQYKYDFLISCTKNKGIKELRDYIDNYIWQI